MASMGSCVVYLEAAPSTGVSAADVKRSTVGMTRPMRRWLCGSSVAGECAIGGKRIRIRCFSVSILGFMKNLHVYTHSVSFARIELLGARAAYNCMSYIYSPKSTRLQAFHGRP